MLTPPEAKWSQYFYGSDGRRMRLLAHDLPGEEDREAGLPLLARWAPLLLRKPENTFQFLPLTPHIGLLVCNNEFDEDVARKLYGVFTNCRVRLNDPRMPIVEEKVWGFPESGITRFLNGLTVLFLACSYIQDHVACSKLLHMPVVGLGILSDMDRNKLGHLCAKPFRQQIKAMLECMYLRRHKSISSMTAWGQRLSLLASIHVGRLGGPLDLWKELEYTSPLLLDLWQLCPEGFDTIPKRFEAAIMGFFAGNALGTLLQHISRQPLLSQRRAEKQKRAVALGTETVQNAVSVVQTAASMAGQAVPTAFSLEETKAALQYWIDSKLSEETETAKGICARILDEFYEHLQGFGVRLASAPVDFSPFHTQFQQSFMMTMETDPTKDYSRNLQYPRAIKEYKIIEVCPSKDHKNLTPDVWRKLFGMRLSPLPLDDEHPNKDLSSS